MENYQKRRIENRIKRYRADKDLTQKQLAKKVGVARQTIHAIETGEKEPSLSNGFKIAQALGKKINKIFKFNG